MFLTGVWNFSSIYRIFYCFCRCCIDIILDSQPKAPNKIKETTYECGMKPFGDSRIQFDVKYYMYALLFIIFDVEAVFYFPGLLLIIN